MKNDLLPATCYAYDLESGEPVLIVNGTNIRTPRPETDVDLANHYLGVTPAQREAMLIGSHFGWDTPGADPDLYRTDGAIDRDKMLALIDRLHSAVIL